MMDHLSALAKIVRMKAQFDRLRASHDRLLAAAKRLVQTDPEEAEAAWNMLKAAIAAAEALTP
jgi:hypothetical protein